MESGTCRRRWDPVPQDCHNPDEPTHWEKMPGGPSVLQAPPGTIFLLLIAAGLGMWLTGGYLGQEWGLGRPKRAQAERRATGREAERSQKKKKQKERPLWKLHLSA